MVDTPIHVQIRQSIQQKITEGHWLPEARIPTEEELARQYNVSRMTVRQAIQKLVERGFLYRRRGVGTFVSPVRMERDLSRLTSFSEDAAALGFEVRSKVNEIKIAPASGEVAQHLKLGTQDLVIRVERLRRHDDTPVALQTIWVPERLCPELTDPGVAGGSVYAYFEQVRNYRLGWGIENIGALAPSDEEKAMLEMPETAALFIVHRTTLLDDGTPVEFSETRYRSDQQAFMITLRR
jgi:GntR family transcriptional regulator